MSVIPVSRLLDVRFERLGQQPVAGGPQRSAISLQAVNRSLAAHDEQVVRLYCRRKSARSSAAHFRQLDA